MRIHQWTLASRLAAIGLALTVATAASARADDPKPAPAYKIDVHGDLPPQVLAEAWPDRPEWLDMYTDIVQGSQLGPNDGWFRRAVAQTRFDWKSTRDRLDRDGDKQISRKEFAGTDGDFARLDRDHDKVLTEADFDFSPHALTQSPGAMVFYRADADGNGKLTREELDEFFKSVDSGGQGFLSLSDVQEAFRSPPRPASGSKAPTGPSKETLVRALFRQELGSLQPGPALGETAPDFTLKTTDATQDVTLAKLVGRKPVVLVFGNITCGPFRSQAGNVEKLYQRYKDRATFVMVYVREAHPTDGWASESNERLGVALAQPRTYEERVSVAQTCTKKLALGFPVLVDTINDTVGGRYSGMPSRLYLIDSGGKVAYKSGRGPFGFKPAELEHSLVLLLQDTEASAGQREAGTAAR